MSEHENEISEKLIAACNESGMGARGLDHWTEPYDMTVAEYNRLPAKYRASIRGYRIAFIVGVGWRRIVFPNARG